MRVRRAVIVLLAAAAAACTRRDARPAAAVATPHYLAGVPHLARSTARDSSLSPDVEQRSFVAPFTLDSIASFYRTALAADSWRIVGGTKDTGQITLYAVRRGQPLWVMIHHVGLGQKISSYTLTSAAGSPDSGAPAPASAGPR